MENYEKLGAFYLGKGYDLEKREIENDLVLYDSKDLTTHAVCVGMTGSGKTGLCVSLLEEAALDGIPALIIDPKGDLSNLLLTFPDLAASDFEPWVDEDEAQREGQTRAEFAASRAELWRQGLADWGQDGERIRRLKESADFAVYTPGSEAGLPVSILSSFSAPSAELLDDPDLLSDRISTTVSSLLGLLGIDADPIRSREHILLSTLLQTVWSEGRDLDLGELIQELQNPPMKKIGVMNLETFYPEKDRFALAMQVNNLLAAPSFQSWLEGTPLDVGELLYDDKGRPRHAIFSIAHLSDPERMFFVSLLLNQALSWMRSRPGTTSLRALIYMDEIFGFVPPVANPPSKKPLLTLLKQARAYGVGVVLATQNPVDLDYKGLSNTGTWFIGRLQTERDKERVLAGLEGISNESGGGFDRGRMERTLAGLGKRVFLLHNVHEDEPEIFHTRWAMSYLRGPMTRDQIRRLMASKKAAMASLADSPAGAPKGGDRGVTTGRAAEPAQVAELPEGLSRMIPRLGSGVEHGHLPLTAQGSLSVDAQVIYQPAVVGMARVHFTNRKKTVQHSELIALCQLLDETADSADWHRAAKVDLTPSELEDEGLGDSLYVEPPSSLARAKSLRSWEKELSDTLYRSRKCELFKSPTVSEVSEPGESEKDFRVRLSEAFREEREERKEKVRAKFETKRGTLQERLRKAKQAVEREADQAKNAKLQTAVSLGATLLSAVFGRRKLNYSTITRGSSALTGAARSRQQAEDVDRALENVDALTAQIEAMNRELEDALAEVEAGIDPQREELESVVLTPRRADIDIQKVAVAWVPSVRNRSGGLTPLFDLSDKPERA